MLISERHNQIIFALQQNPGISVRELSEKLHFSEPTIRRDYTELERRGILTKCYGGAILNRNAGAADREIPFILDAAQSAGSIPVNFEALGAE